MLSFDQIESRLAEYRKPKGLYARMADLLKTIPEVGEHVRKLLEPEGAGKNRRFGNAPGETRARARKTGKLLEEIGAERREIVFARVFGELAPAALMAWDRMPERTYMNGGYTHRPFRAPRDADLQTERRGHWFNIAGWALAQYEPTGPWLAAWADQITPYTDDTPWLLACQIDLGGPAGDRTLEALMARARGEHEVAPMSRSVVRALLGCRRREAWEFLEGMLLGAQRQEGLRQTILESIDDAHPDAFRRMLRADARPRLAPLSAAARAIDVWFGFQWDSASQGVLRETLDHAIAFLDDPDARRAAVAPTSDTKPDVQFLALWAEATEDVVSALDLAAPLLAHDDPERRYIALHMFAQAGIDGAQFRGASRLLDDPDLRVAAAAFEMVGPGYHAVPLPAGFEQFDRFAAFERLLARVPSKATLESIVWPWAVRKLDPQAIADALGAVTGENVARAFPYFSKMSPYGRAGVVCHATGQSRYSAWGERRPSRAKVTPESRGLVLQAMGDASADVRAAAFGAMSRLKVEPDETERLFDLLSRKAGDLRKSCIERLLKLPDDDARAVGTRLAEDKSLPRREAGLEILRTLVAAGRASAADCPALDANAPDAGAEPFTADAKPKKAGRNKKTNVAAALPAAQVTLDDALGLLAGDSRPAPPTPKERNVHIITSATKKFWRAFVNEFASHIELDVGDGEWATHEHVLVGPERKPIPDIDLSRTPEDDAARVPMIDHWREWLAALPRDARDTDGLTLVRAYAEFHPGTHDLRPKLEAFTGYRDWPVREAAKRMLAWLVRLDRPPAMFDLILDRMESILAKHGPQSRGYGMASERREKVALEATGWVRELRAIAPDLWKPDHAVRLYWFKRWGFVESKRSIDWRLSPEEFVGAYAAGVATEADLIELMIGSTRSADRWHGGDSFHELRQLTSLRPPAVFKDHPELLGVVARVRNRILEIELARGELDTPASLPAIHMACTGGLSTLERALGAVGSAGLARQQWHSYRGSPSRAQVMTHLIARSFPDAADTHEAFKQAMARTGAKPRRLIEVGVLAPQWAGHIEAALGWPGLQEACWWIHAHTKQPEYTLDQELLEAWRAQIAERTPVPAEDLAEGAVDVEWFDRMHATLGPERWEEADRAAKFASHGSAHARAKLFASAMLAQTTREELAKRMDATRHPDSVRAIGLVPLPRKAKDRDAEVLARYELLQEFLRQSRKFGSQRQASEKRAVEIGMANLARSAGFPDPLRLQWAMETRAIGDLAHGPVTVEHDHAKAVLSIDDDGLPDLAITKKGKPVKSVPVALRKHEAFVELRTRAGALKKQVARMRLALEDAMCRGDSFTADELRALFGHPALRHMLQRLVFVGDGIMGYAGDDGRTLRDHAGTVEPIKSSEVLRLAHPTDLLVRNDWHDWQAECFGAERVQPFKQVFRELYPRTAQEPDDATSTRRYAGHQVQPHQAAALLKTRGWVIHPELGIRKTFHAEGLTAHLEMQGHYYTPAEVEGWTIEIATFTKRGQFDPLPLGTIPARLFSEVMRDIDLIVSVAHRGGVDPEASASTIEMRAALLRETCRLLNLANVRVEPPRVYIDGTRASYTLHLGSAGAAIGGRALVIVAVHAAHRGRLFLPFADADPKTAEVMSKALLLARDQEIADPGVLEQIRR
ncbi:MAG: DUF5724 domain-containing protein [Phycisphaerales bacterium]